MMKSDAEIFRYRLRVGRLEKLIEELGSHFFTDEGRMPDLQYKETSLDVHSSAMVGPGGWRPADGSNIQKGMEDSLIWLRGSFAHPILAESETLSIQLGFSNCPPGEQPESVEGAIWVDGRFRQGFDKNHSLIFLEDLEEAPTHQFSIRVYFKPHHQHCRIHRCHIRKIHFPAYRLYQKLRCLLNVLHVTSPDAPPAQAFLEMMEKIIFGISFTDPGCEDYFAQVREASEKIAIPPELSEGVWATARAFGHAHIDLAWLWPVSETRLKAEQTFATALSLMEEYPNYTFIQSQPQLYEFVREREPALFEAVKRKVADGQWIAQGASWVECDCNIPSGESLIRQLHYGKQFFSRHFGVDSQIFWAPDTFGFNGQMPQILKGAEVDYFVTSKISWNQYTRFPHDTFRWRGIDGSEIIANFLTASENSGRGASTYNSMLSPSEIREAWNSYAQKDIFNEVMISYGYGDGGGGPTREMLERMQVMGGLSEMPEVTPGSPLETFRYLDEISGSLPVWRGELYLEYHRGTLTSRGLIKKLHRRAEDALALLETAEALNMLTRNKNSSEETLDLIDGLWKELMLNQFHDILAGSSIHRVNVESARQMQSIVNRAGDKALDILALMVRKGRKVYFNPHGFHIPADPSGGFGEIEPFGLSPAEGLTCKTGVEPILVKDEQIVSNSYYRAVINNDGEIISFIDKRNEDAGELIQEGKALNRLEFYQDRPLNWDAWDIDEFYLDSPLQKPRTIEGHWTDKTPERAVYTVSREFGRSAITQNIIFYSHTPRIDFMTFIDWHNKNVLIKAAFPLAVNTGEALYEIPFGHIARPTHRNRLADRACFESGAQRWCGLFERGRGGAVLNDCKYGYSASDGSIKLTLLKSAIYPDGDGEEGNHQFTYSFLPCASSGPDRGLIRQAALLNRPPVEIDGTGEELLGKSEVLSLNSREDHIFISSLKPSMDGRSVILRMYEGLNRRGSAAITLPRGIKRASLVNLLEMGEEEIPIVKNQINLYFRPFQIITVKLEINE